MRPAADLHISRMWDVFSSPAEGVVWDSSRHCWIAQPVLKNVASQYFAPAVLGMEGAKCEAMKCRRAMELEAGMDPSVQMATMDQPKQAGSSMHPGARRGGSSLTSEDNQSRLPNQRSPTSRTPPVRSPPRVQSRTQSPQQSRSPVPSAGNTQRLPPRTNSAPRVARIAQTRQAAGRITVISHEKVVGGSSRDNSPVVRDARHGTAVGREGSPGSFSGARRAYSPLTGRREAEPKQPREPHRPREGMARRQDAADSRRPREAGRQRPKQVMLQLQELQSKVEQMQEEASRERSEKESLRRTNEQLRLQVDKLLKVASIRMGRLDESGAIAEVEASLGSRASASLRSVGSANDTDSVGSSGAPVQDAHTVAATVRNSQSRDSCETESLASSAAAAQALQNQKVLLSKADEAVDEFHTSERVVKEELTRDSGAKSLPSSIEAPVRSAAKKKAISDSAVAGRSQSLGSRSNASSKTGLAGASLGRSLQARATVARSCDALRREPEVSDVPGSPLRSPGSPNGVSSARVAIASPIGGWRGNGSTAPLASGVMPVAGASTIRYA